MVFGLFSSPAKLGIRVNETAVYSGGKVSGTVYLNVTKACDAASLQLVIWGEEYSHVVYETGSGKQRRTHHGYSRRNLLHTVIDLTMFNGKAQPGNYEFPFTAQMPPGLPSSMFASNRGDCKIHYGMKARLHRPGIFTWDTKAKITVPVSSMPMQPEPTPVFSPPAETAVTSAMLTDLITPLCSPASAQQIC